MKQNDLEKILRERLQADRPDVDTDRLWSALDGHLPSEKKRRPPIFWWLSGLTGLLLLLGGMWLGTVFFHEKDDQTDLTMANPTEERSINDLDIRMEMGQALSQQDASAPSTTPLSDPEKEVMGGHSSIGVKPASPDHQSAAAHNRAAHKNAAEDEQPAGQELIRPSARRAADPGLNTPGDPVSKASTGSAESGQEARVAKANVRSTDAKDRNPAEALAGDETPKDPDPSGDTFPEDAPSGATSIQAAQEVPPVLEQRMFWSIRMSGQELGQLNNDELPVIVKSRDQRPFRHELNLSVGIGMTGRQLDDLTTLGTAEKDFRATTEQVLENWSTALSYRYHMGDWYIETGLSGGWFNEKVDAITVTTDSMTLNNVVIEQILQNGQVIEERRGQVTITETIERRLLNYTKLFHLQGGLGIGRKWRLGENTALLTGGGVLYSFYHAYSGTVALGPDRLFDLDRNEGNRFSDDGMQFGAYLSTDLQRHFGRLWSANVGLRASIWQKGIASDLSPVQQRYQSYQLTLGISRHF